MASQHEFFENLAPLGSLLSESLCVLVLSVSRGRSWFRLLTCEFIPKILRFYVLVLSSYYLIVVR